MEPQCLLPYSQNPIISPNPESNWCPCFLYLSVSVPLYYYVLPLSLHNNLSNFVTFHLRNASYMPPLYCYCTVNNLTMFWTVIFTTLSMLQHSQYFWVFSAWSLTLRLLMSYIYIYIYIYGAPILDVSRSYTTTHHSR